MQNTALALSKAYFNTKSFHITARIAILLGIAILITAYNKNLEVASAFMYKQCLVSKNDVFWKTNWEGILNIVNLLANLINIVLNVVWQPQYSWTKVSLKKSNYVIQAMKNQ